MRDLSVLIAARNEEWLQRTIEDVLDKRRANTEVIVILDGAWPANPIPDHPDVTMVYHNKSVGQRAAVNEAARLSSAKFIMKLDAHCIMDEGFDVKLMENCEKDWTVIPAQYNLHVFNWKCKKCGNEWYQSPTPTHCQNPGENQGENKNCDGKQFEKVIVWQPRKGRRSEFYRFDSDLHFQYWGDLKNRPQSMGKIADTMTCIGACWFMHRERFWELDGMDEEHGSWGQMGTELACKTWLSGGRMVTNKNTWYAHLFRTQGGDFGFPYEISGRQTDHARAHSKKTWREGLWPKAKYPLHWLVEKFWPIPGWDEKQLEAIGGRVPSSKESSMKKGIIYYTDNQLKISIAHAVQQQLKRMGLPIASASLKPMNFGKNVKFDLKRGYMTMFKQILGALEALDTEVVFFCEHDVIYHPSHFDFVPEKKDVWYYNVNMWKVNASDGHAIRTDDCKQVSGICVYRETAIKHYRARLEKLTKYLNEHGEEGFNAYVRAVGFEPGTHHREERVDDAKSESWSSEYPNIDIRHEANLTPTRWKPEEFRNQKFTAGWKEAHLFEIPGWDKDQFAFLRLP